LVFESCDALCFHQVTKNLLQTYFVTYQLFNASQDRINKMNSEVELIKRLKRGDTQALSMLMEKYQNYVYTILKNMLYDHEAAEAAQDTFIKAFKHIGTFNEQSKLSTWLYSIAYRTGLDYLRKRKNIKSIDNDIDQSDIRIEEEVTIGIERKERAKLLERQILKLGAQDAAILRMFYFDEMNLKEICNITKLSESNIKIKLFRSRKLLKAHLLKEEYFAKEEYIFQP